MQTCLSEKPLRVNHRKHFHLRCCALWFPVLQHGYKKKNQSPLPETQRTNGVSKSEGCYRSGLHQRLLPECNSCVCINNLSLSREPFAWINIGFALAPVMAPCAGGEARKWRCLSRRWQAGVGVVGTLWGLSNAHLNSLVPNHATTLGDYTLPHSTHTLLPLPVWAPARSFAWNKMEMEPLFMPTEMECVIKGTIVQKRRWR